MASERYRRTQEEIVKICELQKSSMEKSERVAAKIAAHKKKRMAPFLNQQAHLKKLRQQKQDEAYQYKYQLEHPFFNNLETALRSPNVAEIVLEYLSTTYCMSCRVFVPRRTNCLICLDVPVRFGKEWIEIETYGPITLLNNKLHFYDSNDVEIESEINRYRNHVTSDTPTFSPLYISHAVKGGPTQMLPEGTTLGVIRHDNCAMICLPRLCFECHGQEPDFDY